MRNPESAQRQGGLMPAKLEVLKKGEVFTVGFQGQVGGKPPKVLFFRGDGYQCHPPETGTIVYLLGPEVPKSDREWVYRQSNRMLYQLVDGRAMTTTRQFGSGTYRIDGNLTFG
jgi:hypothetical protein